jgi:parallel beta-helix repeat protein
MDKKCGILIICAAILFLCFVGTSSASEWYVDDDGEADFTRIQDAINNATAGDTIIVRNGTYDENLVVDKRLTIRSENGPASTIVLAEDPDEHVFNVTADYVNISGFRVGNATGRYIIAGIYLAHADHCNITNNDCSNKRETFGIYLRYSNNNSISNNNCLRNYEGISLYKSNNNRITNNTCVYNFHGVDLTYSNNNSISNNTCHHNDEGIYILTSKNNNISYNICTYNHYPAIFGGDGIALWYSRNNNISYNKCSKNGADGISLWDSNSNNISNNTCLRNYKGISLRGSNDNSISNNSCSNNDDGIYLFWKSKNNCISKNNCSNNKDDGIYLSKSSNNFIYLNNFMKNSGNVETNDNDSTNIWNSTEKITYTYSETTYTNYLGNYWSDYTGSDTDGGGIGDTPYPIYSDKDDYPLMQPFENYI